VLKLGLVERETLLRKLGACIEMDGTNCFIKHLAKWDENRLSDILQRA